MCFAFLTLFASGIAEGQVRNVYSALLGRANDSVTVRFREFAALPDINGVAAKPMLLVQEPGARSLMVNDMRGPIYRVSPTGQDVALYLNIDDPRWNLRVHSVNSETGFQSFAFHPDFNARGRPGYGRIYTWADVTEKAARTDFEAPGGDDSHDTALLEWTARNPRASSYDGGPPRVLLRLRQPYPNHNGGMLSFNPLARRGQPDYGMLYIGNADGGSGRAGVNLSWRAQDFSSPFGKILRIDPSGSNSASGMYGIPADNPFAGPLKVGASAEIWALGVRNPQRFTWDRASGRMYMTDIGQRSIEELNIVNRGGNLGWNRYEGSYRFISRAGVDSGARRAHRGLVYPIAEFDHIDSLLGNNVAVTGVVVYRGVEVSALRDRIIFGDNPSGEVFLVSADDTTSDGQDHVHRLLFDDGGARRTLLELIRAKNAKQGKPPAPRADLRFGTGPDDQVFILNKADGVIRLVIR
ncbi:MAG: PQQ-dependent sugar dehydrogenase [Gemmatimonadota bacterium]